MTYVIVPVTGSRQFLGLAPTATMNLTSISIWPTAGRDTGYVNGMCACRLPLTSPSTFRCHSRDRSAPMNLYVHVNCDSSKVPLRLGIPPEIVRSAADPGCTAPGTQIKTAPRGRRFQFNALVLSGTVTLRPHADWLASRPGEAQARQQRCQSSRACRGL